MKALSQWLLAFTVCASFLYAPQAVLAKEYSIPTVAIQAQVHSNGSLSVSEQRTYSFEGEYSFAYLYINKNPNSAAKPGRTEPYELTQFLVCDESDCYTEGTAALDSLNKPSRAGYFFVEEQSDRYFVKWYYQAQDERKVFTLNYTVLNAVTLHQDTAELYWQLIGSDWEIPEHGITAVVTLPPGIPSDQLQAWAHGPLAGKVSVVSATEVQYSLSSLPSGQFFEARMIFPRQVMSGGAVGTLSQSEIIAQEQAFIQATQQGQARQRSILLVVALISGATTFFLVWVIIKRTAEFNRFGKDAPLPHTNLSDRLWEAPSDTAPAQVEQLISGTKTLTPKAFTATVLNLVHRRIFKLRRSYEKEGFIFKEYHYYLERTKASAEKLIGVEQAVFAFLNTQVG